MSNEATSPDAAVIEYGSQRPERPPGFRLRRGQNWFFVGLNYAGYYVNRYNLSFASSDLCKAFGFSNADYGLIQTGRSWSYALGQFFNGLLADRLGGRMTMAIGGYGTAIMNVLFGLSFYYRALGPSTTILLGLVMIRSIDGYIQAFGAPGMVKMNSAWFAREERGRFAGIFGLMINLGRFINNTLSPALLAGFVLLGWNVPSGNWQLLFFVPAVIIVVFTSLMLIFSQNTPEAAGYPNVIPRDAHDDGSDEPLPLGFVFRTIIKNELIWLTAWAYFCTGVVRYGVDDWFPKYFRDARHIDLDTPQFQFVAWAIPIVATVGSIASGYVSDLYFKGRRAPVAAFLYFVETVIILIAAHTSSLWGISISLIAIAFTCNATHSILGTAAAMDIGGRKMAGFAAGVIDSWQYIGAGLAGVGLGKLIDHFGWSAWLYGMAGFGILGGVLMLVMRLRENRLGRHA